MLVPASLTWAIGIGKAHVLAFRHRQRKRFGPMLDVELDHLRVGVVVDRVVALERRDRRVDEAGGEFCHQERFIRGS
jgi:hypothetical protein